MLGDRPITPEEINGNYNNFYEFGATKNVTKAAQALKIRPWTVKIDGMVEKPFEIGDRRSDPQDAARRAALSPSLRRGVVDDDPVDRLPDRQARRSSRSRSASAKYVVMQTFQDKDGAGLHARAGIRGPTPKG